jgi:hypothetical protein
MFVHLSFYCINMSPGFCPVLLCICFYLYNNFGSLQYCLASVNKSIFNNQQSVIFLYRFKVLLLECLSNKVFPYFVLKLNSLFINNRFYPQYFRNNVLVFFFHFYIFQHPVFRLCFVFQPYKLKK